MSSPQFTLSEPLVTHVQSTPACYCCCDMAASRFLGRGSKRGVRETGSTIAVFILVLHHLFQTPCWEPALLLGVLASCRTQTSRLGGRSPLSPGARPAAGAHV